MNTFIKNLKFALLVMCSISLLASNAQCADESLPPEVKKLIGMKIAFDLKRGGKVPGWKMLGSYSLINGNEEMEVEELNRENSSIFAILYFNKSESSKTILDARVLPQDSLPYSIKDGSVVEKKNKKKILYFRSMCKRADAEIVVGLMRPEQAMESRNCTHWSNQVKRAWAIDRQTGHITAISPQGVSCYWETEFTCLPD